MERSGSSASGLYPPFGRVEGLGIVGLAVAALPGGTGGILRAAEKDRSVYLWNLVGERLGDQFLHLHARHSSTVSDSHR